MLALAGFSWHSRAALPTHWTVPDWTAPLCPLSPDFLRMLRDVTWQRSCKKLGERVSSLSAPLCPLIRPIGHLLPRGGEGYWRGSAGVPAFAEGEDGIGGSTGVSAFAEGEDGIGEARLVCLRSLRLTCHTLQITLDFVGCDHCAGIPFTDTISNPILTGHPQRPW